MAMKLLFTFVALFMILSACVSADCDAIQNDYISYHQNINISYRPSEQDIISPPYLPAELDDASCECVSSSGDVLENNKHFRIIQPDDLPLWYLRYEILNSDGDVVSCFITSAAAWIEYVNEHTIEIGWSAGTGVRVVRFYSIDHDVFSEYFISPFLLCDEKIAYINRSNEGYLMLVVRDIFDSEVFHENFFFDDFSPGAYPTSSTHVVYLGNGMLKITSLIDTNMSEVMWFSL